MDASTHIIAHGTTRKVPAHPSDVWGVPCLRRWGKQFYEVRFIKDMRVEGGKRMWLCAWAGKDEDGNSWDDSWEPTKHVTPDLIDAYFSEQKAHVARSISVDVRPLDLAIQRTIAASAVNIIDDTSRGGFGRKTVTPIEILSLKDLAVYYMQRMSKAFGMAPREFYDPESKATTIELRLSDPEQIGTFCSFENFLAQNTAVKSLRYRCGRSSNYDMVIVGCVKLRYRDTKHLGPGAVLFELEFETAKINGITGELVGPHQTRGWLKVTEHITALRTYARMIVPRNHYLCNHGWHELPAHIATVPIPA